MKRFYVIFLLCVACFTGCGPKRRTNLRRQVSKTVQNLKFKIKHDHTIQKFKLELLGVECKFCARAAVELLEQIPGVVLAEYVCDNSNNLVLKDSQDQGLSDQFGPGEITSMLDAVYSETQLGQKPTYNNHNGTLAHNHTADRNVNYHVNNFPGFVNLYYKSRDNSQLSNMQIKQVLNSDGFDLKTIQLA